MKKLFKYFHVAMLDSKKYSSETSFLQVHTDEDLYINFSQADFYTMEYKLLMQENWPLG